MRFPLLDPDPASLAETLGHDLPPPTTALVPGSRHRRCYGAAVEAAVADVLINPSNPPTAPRLHELLSQLDADGHNIVALRIELDELVAWG